MLDYQATPHVLREITTFLAQGAMPALLEKLCLKWQGPEANISYGRVAFGTN